MIIGWRLCELARTGDITASHVEPIPLHPPLRHVSHGCPPPGCTVSDDGVTMTSWVGHGARRSLKRPSPQRSTLPLTTPSTSERAHTTQTTQESQAQKVCAFNLFV